VQGSTVMQCHAVPRTKLRKCFIALGRRLLCQTLQPNNLLLQGISCLSSISKLLSGIGQLLRCVLQLLLQIPIGCDICVTAFAFHSFQRCRELCGQCERVRM
jgi:hypothetical protein